ncbi:subtilisin-like protease SBT2.5 isoform X3 [Jatropha curcas]|uniref:subtilisin-like protease SBT2.5 isoform X3 n=1 Tax=Jatropha curcas TaxID=180498 RepID=UPI0005FB53FA|nr:subtilisin-like protease SBT2.5 isoform X3 [Jatropha curcas]
MILNMNASELIDRSFLLLKIIVYRTKKGAYELDLYLSRKHDELLANNLDRGTYRKTLSLVIVDGFAVEITEVQANVLRSANGVRVVEKNQEVA